MKASVWDLYAEWQITQAIRATVRGGPTFYLFDSNMGSSRGTSLNTYYAGLQVSYQLTDYLSHQLGIVRDVSLGLNSGSAYIEQFTANYSVSWALTQKIGLSVNLSYVKGTQPLQSLVIVGPGIGFVVSQTEDFEQYGVGPSVSWRASDKLSTSLSYNYYLRESNLAGRGYTVNSVTLSVTYAF